MAWVFVFSWEPGWSKTAGIEPREIARKFWRSTRLKPTPVLPRGQPRASRRDRHVTIRAKGNPATARCG